MDTSLLQFLDSLELVDPLRLSQDILMANYGEPSVCFVRGNGAWLYDTEGRAYLDFLSGISVTSLGHAHPKVAQAISAQAETLIHVSNIFANVVGPKVASIIDRLIRVNQLNESKGRVFFANSGAEANEAAIKLSRRYGSESNRHHIISATGSFHGRTMGALSATGQRAKQIPFEPLLPGFTHVPFGDTEAIRNAISNETVAIMLEPIQGEAGVIDAPVEFLSEVRKICDQAGILLILDEVQTGFGRTGSWFGFQRYGILPDIVTMAKALGSGMPISACWAKSVVANAFQPGDHGTTFGGQPLACSAALATIRELIEIDAPKRAQTLGDQAKERLAGQVGIANVSGNGLLLGVNLMSPIAKQVGKTAMSKGLIINPIGDNILRLAPPIVVNSSEIDQACDVIIESVGELS